MDLLVVAVLTGIIGLGLGIAGIMLPKAETDGHLESVRAVLGDLPVISLIESAHGVAAAIKVAEREPGARIIVNLSGRGDKDMQTVMHHMQDNQEKHA